MLVHIDCGKEWRGGQSQALYLVKGLKERRYDVTLICQKGSALHHRAEEESVEVYPLKIKSEFDFISAFKISKILKKKRAKIIHFHDSHSVMPGILASIFYPVPIKIPARKVDFSTRGNPFRKLKYDKLVTAVIAVSKGVKDVLVKDGIPEPKIHLIYEGTDLKKFEIGGTKEEWKERLGLSRNKFIAGIVAHLADHKGHIYLIQSAKILKEKGAELEILIIGDGELKDFLISKTKELGIEDMVKFLGFRKDIPYLLKAIDLFVLSSYLEGLCTSLLDAMASKLPIVATRTGGIPEAVEDGVNGILVPPRDPSALAEAIYKLYKNRELLNDLGEKGYERVKNMFSVERMVENTINLYNKLLKEKGLEPLF
ncbi:MAG: glycosyltransferase family 4 protein [Candidatus Aminicenantia bacterium]